MTEEILDLVDESDNVIGTKSRANIYAEKLKNYRVVNGFVVNKEGKLWIPRRTADKKIFPLCLDMSVAGHVESGEDYDGALRRELKEELSLNLNKVSYKILGKLNPYKDQISSFMTIYEIKADEVSNYNKEDFIEATWLTPKELIEKINSGDKAKDDLPKLIQKFYLSSNNVH